MMVYLFLHLATVLISVYMLCYVPGLLFRGPPSILNIYIYMCEPGSSVGIATGYGLDGPGIESR
jgi:hypothetical protein